MTVTDVLTVCVILRVKVICISSVDGIKLCLQNTSDIFMWNLSDEAGENDEWRHHDPKHFAWSNPVKVELVSYCWTSPAASTATLGTEEIGRCREVWTRVNV